MKDIEFNTERNGSIFSALKHLNENMESLALIMTFMTDNPGFYAKVPVTQDQIDKFFPRH